MSSQPMTLDGLRQLVARAVRCLTLREAQLDNLLKPDRRGLERVAYLASAAAALAAVERLAAKGCR